MKLDFHYYMTYVAARIAGFDRYRSQIIALCAEFVDETYTNFNKIKGLSEHRARFIGGKKTSRGEHVLRTSDDFDMGFPGVLNLVKFSTKKTTYTLDMMEPWVSFHFLPGNYGQAKVFGYHDQTDSGMRRKFTRTQQRGGRAFDRMVKKWRIQRKLICAPNSLLSQWMIDEMCDTRVGDKSIGETQQVNIPFVEKLMQESINSKTSPGFNTQMFWLALVGIRMHVLADTFAHAGFAGVRSKKVNDVKDFCHGVRMSYRGRTDVRYLDPIRVAVQDGRGPKHVIGSFFGHGRAGSYPDTPSIVFKWTRPADNNTFTRDCPEEFYRAFNAMVESMRRIRASWKNRVAPNPNPPYRFGNYTIDKSFFMKLHGKQMPVHKNMGSDLVDRMKYLRELVHQVDNVDLGMYHDSRLWLFGLSSHFLTHWSAAAKHHLNFVREKIKHRDVIGYSFPQILNAVKVGPFGITRTGSVDA